MEPKRYQKTVLEEIERFLRLYDIESDPARCFSRFWKERLAAGDDISSMVAPYRARKDIEAPFVCVKVPTGGGKTFIACKTLTDIFASAAMAGPKVVMWLVPSLTILSQTLRFLREPGHPYRLVLDAAAGAKGRVEVIDRFDALSGLGLSAETVRTSLVVVVASYDSFSGENKESRKVFQENSNLRGFDVAEKSLIYRADPSSLANVLASLRPVCIVDEGHNATSKLKVEMIANLRPRLVLELTATPREGSNIIAYADPGELKAENMIKLPVIVYNCPDLRTVVQTAIDLRASLERAALELRARGGPYIRPIALLQAEPRTGAEKETHDRLRRKLEEAGIPKSWIAVKTADVDELKGRDLMAESCDIRFVITVNALKEGWDCPFAYILATVANRNSAVDVEQILGRILRKPYARAIDSSFLDVSYALTSSTRFTETLDKVVAGLNRAGFSADDYLTPDASEVSAGRETPQADLSGGDASNEARAVGPGAAGDYRLGLEEIDDIALTSISVREREEALTGSPGDGTGAREAQDVQDTPSAEPVNPVVEAIRNLAGQAAAGGADRGAQKENVFRVGETRVMIEMQETFRKTASDIVLPHFYVHESAGIFDDETGRNLLSSDYLCAGYDLGTEAARIEFDAINLPVYLVDYKSETEGSKATRLQSGKAREFFRFVSTLSEADQRRELVATIMEEVRKIDGIRDSELADFIRRILAAHPDRIEEMKTRPSAFAWRIREYIREKRREFAERQFYAGISSNEIFLEPSWKMKRTLPIAGMNTSIPKSLYRREAEMNGFELQVARAMADLGNVAFWQKNPSVCGFRINGAFKDHYPDFIVRTAKGITVVIESKGGDRDNSDSGRKLKLGTKWADLAGPSIKYFMVFDSNPLPGSFRLDSLVDVVGRL